MAKQEKQATEPTSEGSGGINPGVAIIGFLMCFLAGAALMWGYDQKRTKSDIGDDTTAVANWNDEGASIPISSKDPMWGNRDAPVTIVHFSDFQCPYCSKVDLTMDEIKKAYGKDKVRIIWKNEPLSFHPNAKPAAEAAMGVFALKGNDGFWKFHDTAFHNQSALSRESYEKWAKEAGVDMPKFKAGLDAHTWAARVDADHELAQKVGVNGTPASYINGVEVGGAQPFEKFKSVIDQELAKAQAKIAAGTPKDKVYVTMSLENKKNAPPPAEAEDDPQNDTKTVNKIGVEKSPIKGDSNTALVTIIEFSDFQCPYCKRVEPSLQGVAQKYGNKVRFVWKHEPLPFHPRAEPAAEVALEARAQKGDKGFWDMHDLLFGPMGADPNRPDAAKLEDADFEGYAKQLGLDVEKVKTAIKTHKYKAEIDADQDQAEDFGASGTPHFFINGRRLVGAQPQSAFEKIIDEEIKKAQDLLAKGTSQADLYSTLIKDGKGPAAPEKKTIAASANAPAKGALGSKVTVTIISDFQCPYCKMVEETLTEVYKNYGTKVKFVWRNKPLPMHPDAPLAAEAALEAFKQKGNDGFWKYHDKLFAAQGQQDGLKRENLEKIAQEQGLDMAKFKASLDNHSHKAEVDADAKAADDAGIGGTPAFVVNGYFVNGAQPYGKFRKVIELALAEAK